jgi:hypothetical protein
MDVRVDDNFAELQGIWRICVTFLEFALLLSSPFVFPLSLRRKNATIIWRKFQISPWSSFVALGGSFEEEV